MQIGQRLLVSIFALQQEIQMYDTYQRRGAECDQELQKHLRAFVDN
jgi:hypothetical protein